MALLMTERHYDATMDEVWPILVQLVSFKYKKVKVDELSRGISFKTKTTGMYSGQSFEVSVSPDEGGTTLRLGATTNRATKYGNGQAQANVAEWIYRYLGEFILKERAKAAG